MSFPITECDAVSATT